MSLSTFDRLLQLIQTQVTITIRTNYIDCITYVHQNGKCVGFYLRRLRNLNHVLKQLYNIDIAVFEPFITYRL